MAGTFRDLMIWQKGFELLMIVKKITAKYPKEEKFALTDQTDRSANGVIASIAEAYGRYYFADKARTLYVGRGECLETQSHLSVARGLGYIEDSEFNYLDGEYQGLSKGINSYIKSLKINKKRLN